MSDKLNDFENSFRRLELESDAALHMQSKENRKALAVLRELRPLHSNEDVVAKFYFMTLESECHLILEEYSAASAVIHEIDKLLTSSNTMSDEVKKMATKFKDSKMYIRAYIAFYAACKLYLIKSADNATSKIESAFCHMQDIEKEMVKSTDGRNVLTKHMIPAMKKVVEELVSMTDNGSHDKVKKQAWCYSCIAWCYNYAGDNEQYLAMNEAAIKLMKEKLGDDAEKCRVTGHSYHNAGHAYEILKQTDKARSAYKSAIRVYGKATDFTDEKAREKKIEISRNNLDRL